MRFLGMRLALLAVAALATPAAADRPTVTSELLFSMGAIDVGPVDGFSPGGHVDLGLTFENVRLQAELDAGGFIEEGTAADGTQKAGSYVRAGGAVRYYFWNLGPRESQIRIYAESGLGHEWIDSPSIEASRPDAMLGFGMSQQAKLGRLVAGGHFGMRIYVSQAPPSGVPFVACRGACDEPGGRRTHDVALFFTMGGVLGR